MSTVSSATSSSFYSDYTSSSSSSSSSRRAQHASKLAEELFSALDTTGKGYIQESDLASALSSAGSSTSSTSSASDIFSQLDSDGDGKVTQSELKSSIAKLESELDDQFNQSRMEGAMPPPPPSSDSTSQTDTGFTKDELTAQLSSIGSTDSARSSLISEVVQNFSAADTNGDGKVTFAEAQAYDQSASASTSSTTSSTLDTTSSSSTSTQTSDAKLLRQLMDLLRTYGDGNSAQNTLSTLATLVSTAA